VCVCGEGGGGCNVCTRDVTLVGMCTRLFVTLKLRARGVQLYVGCFVKL
jgi:hypothetical protein